MSPHWGEEPRMNTPGDQWLLLDSGIGDHAWNMAVDEALMECVATLGTPVLRFYGWSQAAASFGYFQKIGEIESITDLRPLVRRPTGGGLVPHDADWTYSVAVPPGHSWYELKASESYQRMHEWIRDAFALLSVPTMLAPTSRKELVGQCFAGYEQYDLLWLGKKMAGAAQRRARQGLLIQGSVQPQPRIVTRAAWQQAMRSAAVNNLVVQWLDGELPSDVAARATELRDEKYSQDAYNRKR